MCNLWKVSCKKFFGLRKRQCRLRRCRSRSKTIWRWNHDRNFCPCFQIIHGKKVNPIWALKCAGVVCAAAVCAAAVCATLFQLKVCNPVFKMKRLCKIEKEYWKPLSNFDLQRWRNYMPAVSFAGQQFGMAYFIIYHFKPRLKALDDSETWKKKVGPMWLFFSQPLSFALLSFAFLSFASLHCAANPWFVWKFGSQACMTKASYL